MAFPFPPPPTLSHPPSLSLFFARYQGLQVIVEKIMTACLPACLFCLSWACASQTVSVQPESLAERAGGRVASYQLTVFTGPASRAALIKNSSSAHGLLASRRSSERRTFVPRQQFSLFTLFFSTNDFFFFLIAHSQFLIARIIA